MKNRNYKQLIGKCIKGGEHGFDLIKALEDGGGVNPNNYNGEYQTRYYFVQENGWISSVIYPKQNNLTEITLSELKEIVYAVDWDCPPKYVKSIITGNVFEYIHTTNNARFKGKVVLSKRDHQKGEISEEWVKEGMRLLTSSELSALEKDLESEKKVDVVIKGNSQDKSWGIDFATIDSDKTVETKIDLSEFWNNVEETTKEELQKLGDNIWGNSTHESRMEGFKKMMGYMKENSPELFSIEKQKEYPIQHLVYQELLSFEKQKVNTIIAEYKTKFDKGMTNWIRTYFAVSLIIQRLYHDNQIEFEKSLTGAADLANSLTDKYEQQRESDFTFENHAEYVVYDDIRDFVNKELNL